MTNHTNNVITIYYRGDRKVEEPYQLRSFKISYDDEGVALVTLNIPKAQNPLTPNLIWELFLVLEHLKRDESVKVVVWTGAGKGFCSGAAWGAFNKIHVPQDVMEGYRKNGMSPIPPRDIACKGLTMAFWNFPKVSISAVNGAAVGGGANIGLFYNDLVFLSPRARFKWPFVELGVTPELGSSLMLPAMAGLVNAKRIIYEGDWLSAEGALRLGLANEIVPHGQLVDYALEVARKLAGRNQSALRLSKRVLNSKFLNPGRQNLDKVLDEENATINEAMMSKEFRDAMKAFQRRHGKKKKRSKL